MVSQELVLVNGVADCIYETIEHLVKESFVHKAYTRVEGGGHEEEA